MTSRRWAFRVENLTSVDSEVSDDISDESYVVISVPCLVLR